MKLALRVERQLKAKGTFMGRFRVKDGFSKAMGSKTLVAPRIAPKVQIKSEEKQPQSGTTGSH